MFAATILSVRRGFRKAMEIASVLQDIGIEVRIVPQITEGRALEQIASSWISLDFAICVSSASLCVHLLKDIARMPFDPGVVAVSPLGRTAVPLMNCGLGGARALCRFLERKEIVDRCVDTSYAYDAGFVNLNELPFILRLDLIEKWRKLHSLLLDIDRGAKVSVYSSGRMLKVVKRLPLPPTIEFVDDCREADLCILPALGGCSECGGTECSVVMKARPLVLSLHATLKEDKEKALKAINEVLNFFGMSIARIDYAIVSTRWLAAMLSELGVPNVSIERGCNAIEMLYNRWRKVEVLLSYRHEHVHVCLAEVNTLHLI
ncbi:MAG: hypothetical protein GXO32_08795 [Crenarchaeota archaeon]|nr:hypothetical protein [Thermoproteota archaeon]